MHTDGLIAAYDWHLIESEMKTTTYYGCGHHWVRCICHFDDHDEVIEGWLYQAPWKFE